MIFNVPGRKDIMVSESILREHRDLKVFQLAYQTAMEVFHASQSFPVECWVV